MVNTVAPFGAASVLIAQRPIVSQAPAQTPQPMHRSGSTCACAGNGLPSVRGTMVIAPKPMMKIST